MVVRLAVYCSPVWDPGCFLKHGLSGVFGPTWGEKCDIHGCCSEIGCDCPLKGIKVRTVRMSDDVHWSRYFPKFWKLCLVYMLSNSGEQLSEYLHQGWIGFWRANSCTKRSHSDSVWRGPEMENTWSLPEFIFTNKVLNVLFRFLLWDSKH